MRAGILRHRVMIEKKTKDRDEYGGEIVVWTTDTPAWASIKPLRGSEYYDASQIRANITHNIEIRYTTLSASTKISPGYCRLKWGNRIFDIDNVINVEERSIKLLLMCNESV